MVAMHALYMISLTKIIASMHNEQARDIPKEPCTFVSCSSSSSSAHLRASMCRCMPCSALSEARWISAVNSSLKISSFLVACKPGKRIL